MSEDPSEKSLLTQEKLSLKSWGLPKAVIERYASKGIENMFPWQLECLTCEGVLSGRNLVYSAPTSAGKTMVAEILTIQTVLERKKKAIIVLPFISVVREKMLYFQSLLGNSGVRVEGFMGSHAPAGGLRSVHVAVCTIEKANSLINRLLEDQGLDSIGCVVVDEIHLLGDSHRGYLLELLLTKLKYMCFKDKALNIQIVGMSATLPNIAELARWLDAALYTTNFRPIPLTEYLKVNSNVYDVGSSAMELKYTVKPIVKFKSDPGDVVHLCLEALLNGHSVLVFCPTRSWCETCAQQIAVEFRRIGYEKSEAGLGVRAQLNGGALSDVLEQLKRCPASLDPVLARSVAFGVAFHHAGLTMDERDIVEGAFRSSVVRVLVATSTLSSGVNLPARRVLIRCPPRNNSSDVLNYRQMVGRAGRLGKDTQGESFLICNGSERVLGEQLVQAQLPAVCSTLADGDLSASLKRAVLEVIASGVVNSLEDVETYAKSTFLASSEGEELKDPLAACVEYLQLHEFIRVKEGTLGPTAFAEACLAASLSPDMGLKLLTELHRARQCFVLETELHVIYQVTPFSVSDQWGQMDWLRVLSLWEDLPIGMKRVGELVGVEERFLVGAVRGTVNTQSCGQKLSIHRRFFIALALQDLVNEVPLPQVAVKFDCTKGMLQSLQQSASTFAGMVTQFSRRLGWSNVELLVGQFCARLQFGAQRELLDLLRLDCLTAVQARALYTAGVQTLSDLATAAPVKLERALSRASPFQSGTESEASEVSDKRCVWLVGHRAFSETEAAKVLIQEARQFLERELGLKSANWEDSSTVCKDATPESMSTQYPDNPPEIIASNFLQDKDEMEGNRANPTDYELEKRSNNQKQHLDSSSENQILKESSGQVNKVSPKSVTPAKPLEDEKCSAESIGDKDQSTDQDVIKSPSQLFPASDLNKSAKGSKRESLDLFDSSDNLENNGMCNDSIFETSNDNDNIVLKTTSEENRRNCSSTQVKNKESYKNICCSTMLINELGNKEIPTEKKNEPQRYSLMLIDNVTNTKLNSNISTSTPNSVPLIGNNVFFDSPLPDELSEVEKSSFFDELDANIGGESILEMSSFNLESEKRKSVRNISFIELSSSLVGKEERKRKHSIGVDSISKKSKLTISTSIKSCQKEKDLYSNELQVSKITSTNSAIPSNNNRSPSISKYFEDSLNVDSNFFTESFNVNSVPKQNYESFTKNNTTVNDSSSFELHLSPEHPGNDLACSNECSVQSIVCDKISDSSENCFKYDNKLNNCPYSNQLISSCNGKNMSTDKDNVREDSKSAQVLKLETLSNSEQQCFNLVSNICDKKQTCSNVETENNKSSQIVNKYSFCDSFIVDSKLNALLERSNTAIDAKKDEARALPKSDALNVSDSIFINSKISTLLTEKAGPQTVILEKNNPPKNNNNKNVGSLVNSLGETTEAIITKTEVKNESSLDQNHSETKQGLSKQGNVCDISSIEPGFNIVLNINDARKELVQISETNSSTNRVFKSSQLGKSPTKIITSETNSRTNTSIENALNNLIDSDFYTGSQLHKIEKQELEKIEGTESMENKEMFNISSDEDTVFGTPVPQHKSMAKKPNKSLINGTSYPTHLKTAHLFKTPINKNVLKASTKANIDLKNGINNQTEGIISNVSKDERPNQNPAVCNSLTNSFLEAAFESSFNNESPKIAIDSSQAISSDLNSSHKSVHDVNSPTVNVCKTEVETVTISSDRPDVYEQFCKGVGAQKTISMALTTRQSTEENEVGRAIGARIMKKKPDTHYPCCYEGTSITAVAMCWEESAVYTLPLDSHHYKTSLEILQEVLKNRELTLCVWEAKSAVVLLHQCCRLVNKAKLSDPTVAHWLFQPHANTPTIKQMARMYGVAAPQCSDEAGFQALLVWQLCQLLKTRLKQEGLYSSYSGCEMPIQALLAEMEVAGVSWDREYTDLLWVSVEDKMTDLQNNLYELAGRKFNLRSRSDLAKIRCILENFSEDVLNNFKKDVRNWKVLNSLKTRNLSPLLMLEGARVRGCWDTHTVTGRISMHEPNLQYVPRDFTVDDQEFSLRSAFTAGQGCTLVAADYCQLELRLLAHFSRDPGLRHTLSQPGDVFVALAAEWNQTSPDKVTDSMRQHTKQLCYGLVYGMGLCSLAEELGVEELEASEMVGRFHKRYPGVQAFIDECVAQCRSKGQVTTLSGRRRFLPEITSRNRALRGRAERQAVNTTIQGSAADIAKAAMLRVQSSVEDAGLSAQLIIHLHDELIYEVQNKDVNGFSKILRKDMESVDAISVPLPVKLKKGSSWGQLYLIE